LSSSSQHLFLLLALSSAYVSFVCAIAFHFSNYDRGSCLDTFKSMQYWLVHLYALVKYLCLFTETLSCLQQLTRDSTMQSDISLAWSRC